MEQTRPSPSGTAPSRRPQFQLLTDSQLRDVHEAALVVLAEVGARVYHPEAVETLRRAGCRVADGNLVTLPRSLVEDCLASAPSRIALHRPEAP